MSPINSDLSDLPQGDKPAGRPPVAQPLIVGRLALAWHQAYLDDGNDELAMAIEGARWRASWSGMCARAVGYEITYADQKRGLGELIDTLGGRQGDDLTDDEAADLSEAVGQVEGFAPSDPHSVSDHWRFGIGSMVHEALQKVIVDAFPGAEAEVKIKVDNFGAAHADLVMEFDNEEEFLNGSTARFTTPSLDATGSTDRGLLDLDRGNQQADGLRRDRGGDKRPGNPVDPSGDVGDVARAADSGGSGDRPPLSSEGVREPGSLGGSDARGEQRARPERERAAHAQDPLSPGASVRQEAATQGGEGKEVLGSGVLDLQSADQPRVDGAVPRSTFRVLVELKTCNGFFWKLAATNFKGAPEGPRQSAITQGAVAARAIDADRLIIGYLSLECLSPNLAASMGMDEIGRFSGEWWYDRSEYEPIAERELKRVRRILEVVDVGDLPPRSTPEIPARARITNPAKGSWTLEDDSGAITMAGDTWICGYCNWRSQCIGDGPS